MFSPLGEDLLYKEGLDSHITLALKVSERSDFSSSVLLLEINFGAALILYLKLSQYLTQWHMEVTQQILLRGSADSLSLMLCVYRVQLYCSLNTYVEICFSQMSITLSLFVSSLLCSFLKISYSVLNHQLALL